MTPPFPQLNHWFERAVDRALAKGADPDAVLEATAGALGLVVAGGLEAVPAADLRALAKAARRAILASPPSERGDHDAAEDGWLCVALAKAGLSALDGKSPASIVGPADPLHPSDGQLSAATLGRLDGYALAGAALHLARCDACDGRLAVLRMASAPMATPLRVAAASAVAMREPDAGRVIGTFEAPAAELVLFDDDGERALAVYAEASVPVRVTADGLETIEMLAGYWLGAVASGLSTITGTLFVGDEDVALDIELPPGSGGRA